MSLFLPLLLSLSAHSNPLPIELPKPAAYQCEVILASSFLAEGGVTWNFVIGRESKQHGGEAITFTQAEHEISVMADSRWLGISWSKGGQKIAQGIFVLGADDQVQNRVAILYDPSDSGDQVSLGCGTN